MKLQQFYKKYQGKIIDDWGCYNSDESKQMAKDFKSVLKTELKEQNAEVIGFKSNHYDFSGFVKINNKTVYISYSINRHLPTNLDRSDCMNGFLIRTAMDEFDYHGGSNWFCNLNGIVSSINNLMKQEHKPCF